MRSKKIFIFLLNGIENWKHSINILKYTKIPSRFHYTKYGYRSIQTPEQLL